MTEATAEEIKRDARVVIQAMIRRAEALPRIWDTGHWEFHCIQDLSEPMLRNGGHLTASDQETLIDVGAVIFARVKREVAAEAKRIEILSHPKGTV